MLQRLTFLAEEIFQCSALIEEDAEVIAHDVTVLARGALDENGAAVVALFRHAVRRALATWLAGKSDAIGFLFFATLLVLLLALGVGLSLSRGFSERPGRGGVISV
jgi:hypothetical protein